MISIYLLLDFFKNQGVLTHPLCKRHHEDEKKKGSASHDEEPSIDEFMN